MSGAPGSYVDMEGWLKANDTELYNQINELNQSIINHSARYLAASNPKAAMSCLSCSDSPEASPGMR